MQHISYRSSEKDRRNERSLRALQFIWTIDDYFDFQSPSIFIVDEAHLLKDETSNLDEETKQMIDQVANRFIDILGCLRTGSNPNHDPAVEHARAWLSLGDGCNPE